MQLKVSPYKQSFSSLNKPIPPMTMDTPNGKIYFKEVNYKSFAYGFGCEKLAKFFIDNFSRASLEPDAKKNIKGSDDFCPKRYKDNLINTIVRYEYLSSNPDTTIYVGKIWWGKIVAGIIAAPINSVSRYKDDEILYVDSVAISEKYRQCGVGKALLNNLAPNVDKKFKKLFWVAYNTAVPFYEKLGLEPINKEKYSELVDVFAQERSDYPEFVTFFLKELETSDK